MAAKLTWRQKQEIRRLERRAKVVKALNEIVQELGLPKSAAMPQWHRIFYASADRERVNLALVRLFAHGRLSKCGTLAQGGVCWAPNWCKALHGSGVVVEIMEYLGPDEG